MDLLDLLKIDTQTNYRILSFTTPTNLFSFMEQNFKQYKKDISYNAIVIMDSSTARYSFFDYYIRKKRMLQ